jgi:hypothetical protein
MKNDNNFIDSYPVNFKNSTFDINLHNLKSINERLEHMHPGT